MTLREYYQEKESERNRMGQGKKLNKDMVSTGDQVHSSWSYNELWNTESTKMLTHLKARRPTFCILMSVSHRSQATNGERVV